MATFPCPWCNAEVPAEPLGPRFCPLCGDSLVFADRFLLEARLGSGGMSVVYAARSESGNERAAVKVLSLATAKEWNVLELFDHGARVLMGLRHPGLPLVYDLAQDSKGRHILVRESFDGGTLEERVLRDRQHLEPAAFNRLFEALLEVVAYLHGLVPPVLHRDIKPSNIMFRTRLDWHPVLVDFDTVALPPERRSGLTVVGTPGYAAPEQFYGESVPQSDLFGLAATMLCVATQMDVNALPRQGGRFKVEGRLDNVDEPARRVLLRLLEPDPQQRYASAAEALRELRLVARSPAVAAVPARDAEERQLAPRRRVVMLVSAGMLALGLVVALLASVRRPSAPTATTTASPPPTPVASDRPTPTPPALVTPAPEPATPRPTPSRERARPQRHSSGFNACAPVVPCYQEVEEFGQVGGRLEIVLDANGRVAKAAYSKGPASAKVRRCLVKAAKALTVPEEAERPATHLCEWGGTLMARSQIMSWGRKVLKRGEKPSK